MTAIATMMLPVKGIVSTPLIAAGVLIAFCWLATVVFGQVLPVPGDTVGKTSIEDVFRYGGWTLIIVALLGIAVAAIYNTFRKASITEWKELAEARKGKLIEKELENTNLQARVRQLERENEDLEKKNLRLQDEHGK
jgi:hypothetical protein